MTVRCFTSAEKDIIAQLYLKYGSINELVVTFRRSSRTIQRVLEERGCAPVSKRKLKQPSQVQLPLFNKPISYQMFKAIVPAILNPANKVSNANHIP